ncbi:hypothetical protein TNCV_2726981 [Trichonephila clavipes]|nr:hypothetical protein TNCV_2726981 [Trichonephila clavipes]
MPNSLSHMIPDMLHWRQIWGLSRSSKEIESGFVAKYDLVPFRCSPGSKCEAPLQTEVSMGGIQEQLT